MSANATDSLPVEAAVCKGVMPLPFVTFTSALFWQSKRAMPPWTPDLSAPFAKQCNGDHPYLLFKSLNSGGHKSMSWTITKAISFLASYLDAKG